MKNIVLVTLLFISCKSLSVIEEESYYDLNIDRAKFYEPVYSEQLTNLKGEVRQINYKNYQFNHDQLVRHSTIVFDSDRRVSKVLNYSKKGRVTIETDYLDFKKKNAQSEQRYTKDGELASLTIHKFEGGELVETITSTKGKELIQRISEARRLQKQVVWADEIIKHPNGAIKIARKLYRGRISKEMVFDTQGLVLRDSTVTYDQDSFSTICKNYTYKGDLLCEMETRETGDLYDRYKKNVFTYDSKKRRIYVFEEKDGMIDTVHTWHYNSYGDIILKDSSLPSEYKNYKYDNHQNWIYREEHWQGMLHEINEREIIYR